MPVNEELNGGTLYYEKEDGTYVQIGEVSKIFVQDFESSDSESLSNYHLVKDGEELSAEIHVDEELSNWIRYIINSLGTNNWRKMRGIPMIRWSQIKRAQKRRKRTKC